VALLESGRVVAIGRALDRPHTSIHCLLAHHGGIVPALRRRGLLALTLTEREEISRGMASGSSIRDIARGLERAASMASPQGALGKPNCYRGRVMRVAVIEVKRRRRDFS
jgi:Helix-turn-helix domain